jgi:hypothetical protein
MQQPSVAQQSQLQHFLERLAAAAADPQQPTAETVRSLSDDIHACTGVVLKLRAAPVVQLRVSYHLGRMALLPLRVLAAAATEVPNLDAGVLRTLLEVSFASLSAASTCKAASQDPTLPPGM